MKLLHWQQGGFVLYYKRLEKGTIGLPSLKNEVVSWQMNYTDLVLEVGVEKASVAIERNLTNSMMELCRLV
jgi:transposase